MDPFNMAGLASNPGDTSQLQTSINQLAPMATSFHGPLNPSVAYAAPTTAQASGFLPKLTHFIGGVASEIGHVSAAAGKWLGTQTLNMAEAPVKYGAGIAHGWLDRSTINEVNSQRTQISGRMDTLNALYKSGRINNQQYKDGLDSLNQDLNNLSRQATSLDNQVKIDQVNTQKAAIDTAADVVTILTAGFGKVGSVALTGDGLIPQQLHTAADWLASKGMDVHFKPLESALNKIALDGQTFSKLTPEVQTALQKSTAEVIANTTSALSAGQIARASAVNIALKYPIYYSYLSGTGEQIYHEMATGNDKGALKTLGFNAALLLSGGPIGYALKWGGKAASAAVGATFGKTSFWDELSKFYGKDAVDIKANNAGAPTGDFRQAVDQIRQAVENPGDNQEFIKGLSKESQAHIAEFTPATFNDFVRNLSATEATNMGAVGGHDAVASAYRVAQGMINQRGFNDLTHVSHAEGLLDMSRMAKWQREADAMGKARGKGPLTVGVFDARTVENLAKSNVIEGRSFAERDANWQTWKQANSSYAAANNPNVDKQIQNINKLRSLKSRQEAVAEINAQQTAFRAGELSKSELNTLKQMSKEGFVIIKPANIEAPFKEGTGKLTSAFSKDDEFFVKASQPLPVLGHMGGVLTKMGLSPEASAQQVYQVLNENMARNLESLPVAKTITDKLSNYGEKKLTGNVTDYILKKLQQTKTKVPVRDYRMYTSKQIQEALDISKSDAIDIQNAIAHSFIQTPMAIRGLGDRLVDATYATRPTRAFMSRFTKLQGALRFAWNPFFTLGRLPFKTEALTEAEGGGFIRSVFTGRGSQINDIRTYLRQAGHLNETGNFGVLSGEAVDMAGTVGSLGRDVTPLEEAGGVKSEVQANLGKKLTPMQERSIAGLIDAQATRMGTDWKSYIDQDPAAVRDTIQMIAEYDKKSNFINSPLARTLNIAFFPFRFDIKVATIFARNLAKTDPLTQVAVVNGLLKANQWMSSTEGQQWYAANAEAIGLFKYLTPVASLNEVFKSLLPGHDHHLGNFGELGGLPFGWIPQLTDSEGWTQFNAPGIDAKTGQAFPKYIPADQKAQASLAIQDLVGALYSYPGATVGLPSKSGVSRTIGNALTESSTKDYKKVTVPLNVAQQDYANNVSNMGNSSISQPPSQGPAPGLPVPAAVPPAPLSRKPAGSGSSKSAKKKKGDFTPQLLPGQSTLGQL